MITVVVIGRNDNHGYNLAKRVSASLNSIAEMLNQDDEIIFVDWNTSFGYPVMPVSIQDDLLTKTKLLLRIIRVPEAIHDQVSEGSTRAVIEPLARNVGIRNASSSSKWILSTNTDVLFASPSGKKFNQICSDLQDALWLSYRFEIPEFIWDEFDRRDPITTSRKLLDWHKNGRFIKRIQVSDACGASFPIPDGVGDFQLAPNFLWQKVTGFPEDMKKGWHVDTRLTLQMDRASESPPQLISEEHLLVFHQNHLRNSTSYHSSLETNSLVLVTRPFRNHESWGLKNFDLEEIHIQNDSKETQKLAQATSNMPSFAPLEAENLMRIRERLDYNLNHTINFLIDEFSILPKDSVVHCFSGNSETKSSIYFLCDLYEKEVNFYDISSKEYETLNLEHSKTHLLILDCGIPSTSVVKSSLLGGVTTKAKIEAGLIVYNLEKIAALFGSSKTRVVLIRAQNWATRELARSLFFLPLFNNYTNLLCGSVIDVPTLNFLQKRIFLGGVATDYGLRYQDIRATTYHQGKLVVFFDTILYRLVRILPSRLRTFTKNTLFKIIRR